VRKRVWLSYLYRAGYPAMRTVWFFTRPRLNGVKCVVRSGDEVLLVRHTYGDREQWTLPGGRVRRDEAPEHAAARELNEETGLAIGEWRGLGSLQSFQDFRHDTLHCFGAALDGDLRPELRLDPAEILDAGWFRPDRLPTGAAPLVNRILALAP
jgi:ADP-ribose pyrophosphatase YjhB (NUDIX family)